MLFFVSSLWKGQQNGSSPARYGKVPDLCSSKYYSSAKYFVLHCRFSCQGGVRPTFAGATTCTAGGLKNLGMEGCPVLNGGPIASPMYRQ